MLIPTILKGKDMPKHLALSATGIRTWAAKNNKTLDEAIKLNENKIMELIDVQLRRDVPILTIQLSTQTEEEISALIAFFEGLSINKNIVDKKVRIYVIGNWYDSEPDLVDSIKNMMEKTKDYDNYFLNFCIKYNGQEEILTGVKLLLKKATAKMVNINELTTTMIKENIPSSNYIPPDLIIENERKFSGLMQWDMQGSIIYFTEKMWLDFSRQDFDKAIDYFNKGQ